MTSWAIAVAGLGDERPLPIRVQEDDLDLAPVAGVDQSRRVHDRDAGSGGKPERGCTKPA